MRTFVTDLGSAEEVERSHRGELFQFHKTPDVWLDGTVVAVEIFPEGMDGGSKVLMFYHGLVYGVARTRGPVEGYLCIARDEIDSICNGRLVRTRFLYGHLVDAVNEECDIRGVPHVPLGYGVKVLWDVEDDASGE